ncbi:MAG: hypothetical protein O8C66_11775 [Candidatus Methanoperedens sp.]|nr:hypothetical protein [Candidatus Methanoperedens sp.]MCZ7371180.1 hypothetical protein [Candidatus Methanoperedens sp.]
MVSKKMRNCFPLERANRNASHKIWKKIISTWIVTFFVIFNAGCVEKTLNSSDNTSSTVFPTPAGIDAIKDKIRNNLIGTGIVYRDIAGRPVTYNVTEKDIKTIEKTVIENRTAWKVRIGDNLAWNFYYDDLGNEIIKKEQLFVT